MIEGASHAAPSSDSRPFDTALWGPTQDRRWISKKPRASLESALPNIVWRSIRGIYFYGRGKIACAPRSCCGLGEKTPLNFPEKGHGPKSQKGRPPVFNVRTVPDVIAFSGVNPPAIIDWKVHVFGWRDAWLQLAVYAAALTRCTPHKDFPVATDQFKEIDIELLVLPQGPLSRRQDVSGCALTCAANS